MGDIPANVPLAPQWSLWTGHLGKGFVWAALALFVLTVILWLLRPKWKAVEWPAKLSFILGCLSLFGSFACLTALFVKDQFQFEYVFEHGDVGTDLKYKIAGVWSAQEGSFLLWACTSALFALLTVRGTGQYRRWYTIVYAAFLGCLSGILAYETPFGLLQAVMAHGKVFSFPRGAGMTPSLQNYWVVIHPPTIFTGFGSLTVFFAYGVAAMLTRDASDWVRRVRPWALFTTGVLGLGICMGGLWAYETQGWGGFWAWDPVENTSFVPWLFTVILVHGIIVQVTRGMWTWANFWLSGLPFISFVFGTFLTRSGLLDGVSNHSFVSMDKTALIILRWFMILVTFGFIILAATGGRQAAAKVVKVAEPVDPQTTAASREAFYRFAMLLLCMLAVVVTMGMSWPVIVALRGGEGKKVEEWLYHLVVVWFFIPIMLLMAVAPFVSWRPMAWRDLGNRLFGVVCISIGLTGFAQFALMAPESGVHADPAATVAAPFGHSVPLTYWMLLLIFLCIFVFVANAWRLGEIIRRSPLGIGGFVAHAGLAILMGGLIVSRGYERKDTILVRQNSPAQALDYLVNFQKLTDPDDLYDRNNKVIFDVTWPGGNHFEARPGMYMYGPQDDEPKTMVWPHIERSLSHDVYVAMAKPEITAWPAPQTLKPGDAKTIEGTTIEYLQATHKGPFGGMGAQFGAKVRLTTDGADGERHQYLAEPSVTLTEQGLQPSIEQIGPDYKIAMLGGMDASDKSVQLLLFFSPPIYPITVFYKPLTCLVWLGAGVMTIGGLLSAWSRRRTSPKPQVEA